MEEIVIKRIFLDTKNIHGIRLRHESTITIWKGIKMGTIVRSSGPSTHVVKSVGIDNFREDFEVRLKRLSKNILRLLRTMFL